MNETTNNIPLIETVNLCKWFKINRGATLHAVDNVSLKIFRGETLGVVGESGCGKTTLGRTLLQLIKATSGKIFFAGEDITGLNNNKMRAMRKNMQIIFQDPYTSLDPRKTVVESIAEYMIIHKAYNSRKKIYGQAAKLMDQVGLARRYANSYPHELDGGRRQRIGIARALSLDPKFIVCDEPVSALDVSIQAQILNLLMDLQDELKISYMFVTHDLSVVKHISHRIMVMYMGQAVEMADSEELFNNPKHPYTQALLNAIPVLDISRRQQKIETIRGEVSSPINVKPGCRFAPRCDFCTERCTKADAPMIEISPNHFVACHAVSDMLKNETTQ